MSTSIAVGRDTLWRRIWGGGGLRLLGVLVAASSAACSSSTPAAQPPVDAGVDGSDGVDGSSVAGTWSMDGEAAKYLAQIERLRKGDSADLDLDGVDELIQSKDAEGRSILTEDRNGDGNPEYLRTYDPVTGQVEILLDRNSDGFAETKETRTKTTVVTERDTDGDGTYDWRKTETREAGGTIATKIETDEGSGYAVKLEYRSSTRKAKCGDRSAPSTPSGPDPCKYSDPGKGGYCLRVGADVCIPNNGGAADGADGSCSKGHAERLAKAISCAVQRTKDCLANANEEFAKKMMESLFAGSYEVYCGTSGCGSPAYNENQDAPAPRGGTHGRTNVNSGVLDKMDDDEVCAAVLHEMMHWAGAEDDGDKHGDGVDKVYACGRYCGGSGGCKQTDANTPKDCGISGPSWDCARCASTPEEKARCGSFTKLVDGGDAPWGICHGGLGCILGRCESAKSKGTFDCDGKESSSTFLCCQTCVSGCTDSNDFPCVALPKMENTCNTPDCK